MRKWHGICLKSIIQDLFVGVNQIDLFILIQIAFYGGYVRMILK